jgi:glutamate transport system permease protein
VHVITSNLGAYGHGLLVTVELTMLSFALAVVVGVTVAIMRVGPVPALRAAGAAFVGFMRCVPLLGLLLIIVFGLPKLGLLWSLFASSVIGLGLYTGAFIAEAIRSGINAIPAGQAEAARAVGLRFTQVLRLVVLPQAARTVVPPVGNLFISHIKNTAIAASIGAFELTGEANRLAFATARPVPVFIGAVVAYLLLTLPAGAGVRVLERRVAFQR